MNPTNSSNKSINVTKNNNLQKISSNNLNVNKQKI